MVVFIRVSRIGNMFKPYLVVVRTLNFTPAK